MELIVRATVLYWFMFLVVRGTGKRSLAEFTPLDLLVLVLIGDLVQPGITQEDLSITGAVMAISVITAWTLFGDWATRRFPWARRTLEGCPVVVVRHGEVIAEHLRRERITEDDLKAAARAKGYRDLAAVDLAVVEEDGSVSFIEGFAAGRTGEVEADTTTEDQMPCAHDPCGCVSGQDGYCSTECVAMATGETPMPPRAVDGAVTDCGCGHAECFVQPSM